MVKEEAYLSWKYKAYDERVLDAHPSTWCILIHTIRLHKYLSALSSFISIIKRTHK
mgnify:CR=1 FL=1